MPGWPHAFVAQWVFLTPDGPEHFMRHVAHSNLVQAQEFARAIAGQPELTALVTDGDLADFQSYAEREPVPGSERSWTSSLCSPASRAPASSTLSTEVSIQPCTHQRARSRPTSLSTMKAHLDECNGQAVAPTNRYEPAQGLALAALWALNFMDKCAPDYAAPGRAGTIAIPNDLPYDLSHSDQRQP